MSELYDIDRRPTDDADKGYPLYAEAMIFTVSKRWVMLGRDGTVSPVRTLVGYDENSYSAVRRQILADTGISVGTGAVIFTGLFREPETGRENLMDIWVFRLAEKDDEISVDHPRMCIMTSDEVRARIENRMYSDMGETTKLNGIFTVFETPVCVDF